MCILVGSHIVRFTLISDHTFDAISDDTLYHLFEKSPGAINVIGAFGFRPYHIGML